MKTRQYLAYGVASGSDRLLLKAVSGISGAMTGPVAMARVVHVAHRFPLPVSPHRDPSAYLLSPTTLLTRHSDQFRHLRAQAQRRLGHRGMALVVSPRHGEGRSIAALSLSLAFAQKGARVIYVEADFRRPALHTFFDIPAGAGVADLLAGRQPMSELSACLLATDAPGLRLLPAGVRSHPPVASAASDASDASDTPNALESPNALDSPRLPELLARLRAEGDWIIVDSPPMLSYNDATALLGLVDGVVIVSLEGRTGADDLAELSARLARARARVVGAVALEP